MDFGLHKLDFMELEMFRQTLIKERETRGILAAQASVAAGLPNNFLCQVEGLRRPGMQLSTMQKWAAIYDLRVEFVLDNFWMHAWNEPEMQALWAMSRPFDAAPMLRLWLVSALKSWRTRKGISSTDLAKVLKVTRGGIMRWEADAHDPLIPRCFQQARATGTELKLRLWRREDWSFQ